MKLIHLFYHFGNIFQIFLILFVETQVTVSMKTVKLVSFYLLSLVMTSEGIIVNVLIVNACYKHYRLDKFPEAATGAVLVKRYS